MRSVLYAILGAASIGCAPGSGADGSDDIGVPAEPLDESRLDREADCELGGADCGFPSAGPNGYGTELGKRMENFSLIDCDGEIHEFAELFQRREDAYGDFNRAVLFSLGAGWCEPCKEETEDLPGVLEEFSGQGLAIVQVLFQDDVAGLPSTMFCREWKEDFGLEFLVLLDQTGEFFPTYLQDVQAATPVSIVVDANANIRYKLEGDAPPNIELEIEQVLEDPYGD